MKKYDKYKNSGVEWLGEIPEHWEVKKLKFLSKIEKGIMPKKIISENNKRYPPYMSMEYLRGGKENQWVLDENIKIVDKNEILLLWDGSNAGEFIKSRKGVISSTVAHIQILKNKKQFIWYCLKFLEKNIRQKTVGMGIPHVNGDDLKRMKIFLPPLAEQTAIANFLDEKTAKIDKAIANKQKLIELLKERKQIIIQNAVTKGLNPNAKMKNSGIDWIGDIPEHWEVKRLKYVLKSPLKYGANESGIEYNPNLPRYIRITDFSENGLLNENKKLSLPIDIGKNYLLEDGDILFARSGATVGKTYQFKKSMSIEKNYAFAGYLIKASCNKSIILSDFLYLYTQSGSFEKWKELIFNKATIENIGADKYSQLFLPIPLISEQEAIVEYIESETAKIDKAINLQEKQIEKLKEYKTVLIDSAVTGKIKVS